MDPLSDVLRAVRLDGAFFYTVEAAHPWGMFVADARERVPRVLPGAENLISYHIVTSGSCWGGIDAETQVFLEPGDVIVFPHGDGHLLSSDQGCRMDATIYTSAPSRSRATIRRTKSSGSRTAFAAARC